MSSRLRYSEAFYSVQGEGKFVGVPSVFLRTFGCNFRCMNFGIERYPNRAEKLKQGIKYNPEVKQLLENGVKKNAPAMSSIGYREVISYLDQELDKNQMIKKIFSSTRKLMRHQDNWFKKSDKRIKWVDFDNSFEQADNIISMWLSKKKFHYLEYSDFLKQI